MIKNAISVFLYLLINGLIPECIPSFIYLHNPQLMSHVYPGVKPVCVRKSDR